MFHPSDLLSMRVYATAANPGNIDNIGEIGDITDGVTNIAGAISDYGPLIVIMAVFIVIVLLLFVFMLRSNAKMMSSMNKRIEDKDKLDQEIITKFLEDALNKQSQINNQAQNSNAVMSRHPDDVKAVIEAVKETIKPIANEIEELNEDFHKHTAEERSFIDKHKRDEEYHHDLVGAYIDVNMAFKDASRKTLMKINCSRLAIYVFHNGNNSIHGLPFFKISCIHEWTNRGSATLRGKYHTDMPLHVFNDFIQDLYSEGIYKAADIREIAKEDPSIELFTSYSKTESAYMIAIRDDNGKLAGFIVAEFENRDTFDVDPDRDHYIYNALVEMNAKVSPAVANHYIRINHDNYKGSD